MSFASKRVSTLHEDDLVDDGGRPSAPPSALEDTPFAVGRVLAGKYLLEAMIAEGGLGIVMRAMHVELGKPVAIKFLKPHILGKPVLVERFRREAQLAASIQSDHVVRVLDVGSVEHGGPFMVMELLEGEDLGTVVSKTPLPVDLAIDYLIQACDALAEAHVLGIVHRDLKPENLFVVRRKNTSAIIKILDFGISKTYERKVQLEGAPRVRQMTGAEDRFGTPLYMSPEQLVKTSSVDSRTDIWALGVVLYELVTGALPFDADTVAGYSACVVSMPHIPISTRLANAPPNLDAIIDKCLEKNPDERYRNVAELVVELVSLVAPGSITRTDRIKRFVLEGGDSIRPPRPLSSPEITVTELPPLIVNAKPLEAPFLISAAPTERERSRPWPLIAIGGGLLLIMAIAIVVLLTRPAPEVGAPPTTARTVAPEAAPPAPVVSMPAVTAAPEPTPSATVSTAKPTPPAPAPRAAPAPKRNDYNEFGDRH
jgi:serine/threonine protein kinase